MNSIWAFSLLNLNEDINGRNFMRCQFEIYQDRTFALILLLTQEVAWK